MSISNHVIKNGMTINTAKVYSNELLPKGSGIPGRALNSIKYITIHNTGSDNVPAKNYQSSLKNSNQSGRQASWHMAVDNVSVYQHVRLNWECWHAGDSTGNKNSIGIECTQWTDKEKQRQTWENAAAVTAVLMKHYGISISNVVQHNKWSGKNCPEYLRSGKHGYNWTWFIDRVKAHFNGSTSGGSSSSSSNTSGSYTIGTYQKPVKITADSLNVRSGRGSEFSKIGSFTNGTITEVWYIDKAKDGSLWGSCSCSGKTGYIHMGYTTPVYTQKTTTDNLNMRNKPSTSGSIILSIPKGKKVDILQEGEWCKVRYDNKEGYCSGKYLK